MTWKTVRLSEVCKNYKKDIVDGPFGSNLKKEHFQQTGVPVLKIQNVKEFNLNNKKLVYVSDEKFRELRRHAFQNGDLVMTKLGAPLGVTALVENHAQGLIVADLVRIRSDESIVNTRFLEYQLNSRLIRNQLNSAAKGATRPRITLNVVRDLEIQLPTLLEQERILARLDAAFAEIDTAIEALKKNAEYSNRIFDETLAATFHLDNPSWETQTLESVTEKIGSGATPKGGQKSYKREGISLIRSMNVHDMLFKYEKLAKIDDEQAAKLSNVALEEGDVLLNITGASVARCCVVASEVLPARVNQHVSIIRVKENTILPELLAYGLVSKPYKDKLLSIGDSGGSTRQAITKKQIEHFVFSYPTSRRVQAGLVEKLDCVSLETQELAGIYKKQIDEYACLKSAILAQELQGEAA